jgi:hypothetical protein
VIAVIAAACVIPTTFGTGTGAVVVNVKRDAASVDPAGFFALIIQLYVVFGARGPGL